MYTYNVPENIWKNKYILVYNHKSVLTINTTVMTDKL